MSTASPQSIPLPLASSTASPACALGAIALRAKPNMSLSSTQLGSPRTLEACWIENRSWDDNLCKTIDHKIIICIVIRLSFDLYDELSTNCRSTRELTIYGVSPQKSWLPLSPNRQKPSQAGGCETYIHSQHAAILKHERWWELMFDRFSMTGRGFSNIHTRSGASESVIVYSILECIFEHGGCVFHDSRRVLKPTYTARSRLKVVFSKLSRKNWECMFERLGSTFQDRQRVFKHT